MSTDTARDGPASGNYDTLHARLLARLPELIEDLGGDAGALGLMPQPDSAAPSYRELAEVLDVAARRLPCPDLGMKLAARQNTAEMFGPLGQAMRNSRTFGDALTFASSHAYAHSLAARIWISPQGATGEVFAGHDILLEGVSGREQAIEHVLLAGHLSAMELTGGHARARRVHFRHAPISSPRTYFRFFGCEVAFGQPADGMVFGKDDLSAPVVAPDSEALKEITALIDRQFTQRRPPFHAEVRAVILRLLPTGNCTTDQAARTLCMHLRTLHRRLRAEGTSFQLLKEDVRRDLLRYYLERTDLDLMAISERLGFAEQSVLSRYCRRSFGAAPGTLRERLRPMS
ncbi:AraC family transcriptional regulator [Croceicoccus gelatinilyticus]|uniref:AraC family transcriptional regulator n=1 Tax=Croceicoccus gelatinilyticus TaxID=2835536 RepID=UPI001BCC99E8|nr:AraC family transcriptional regulator [Croceicoccus gelatinilyticus]MBS7669547.1 AraC family transcriptional regulator ligand-binding domain-containing protein [Croceicoccus gelatinilyticus]